MDVIKRTIEVIIHTIFIAIVGVIHYFLIIAWPLILGVISFIGAFILYDAVPELSNDVALIYVIAVIIFICIGYFLVAIIIFAIHYFFIWIMNLVLYRDKKNEKEKKTKRNIFFFVLSMNSLIVAFNVCRLIFLIVKNFYMN